MCLSESIQNCWECVAFGTGAGKGKAAVPRTFPLPKRKSELLYSSLKDRNYESRTLMVISQNKNQPFSDSTIISSLDTVQFSNWRRQHLWSPHPGHSLQGHWHRCIDTSTGLPLASFTPSFPLTLGEVLRLGALTETARLPAGLGLCHSTVEAIKW